MAEDDITFLFRGAPSMTARGHTRPFNNVGSMSGLPESRPQRLTTACRMSANRLHRTAL